MKNLKSVALATAVGMSAIALTACSAGQISQTADQVPEVNGVAGETPKKDMTVRDVVILVNPDGTAALKFTASNQDPNLTPHSLKSVTMDGQQVELESQPKAINNNCSLNVNSKQGIEATHPTDHVCLQQIPSKVQNTGLALGGNKDVVFTFDSGEVKLSTPIVAPTPKAGSTNRTEGLNPATVSQSPEKH